MFKTLKTQLAQMTALMATTFAPTAATSNSPDSAARSRVRANKNGKSTAQGRHHVSCVQEELYSGHDTDGCWFNVENKLKEAGKMKSDAEDTLKSTTERSNKKATVKHALLVLHGTDVSEFIHARYGSLMKFLQDGNHHDDFVVTIGSKGTCYIAYGPKMVLPKPVLL